MTSRGPVLMIGLDAAEITLVERLAGEERLPTLKSLMQKGCLGVLDSVAATYAGGVWPTFYTSQDVPWHGIYHNKLWRPEKMRCEVPGDDWPPAEPFWEALGRQGYRVCLIDVPMTLGRPKPMNGVHLAGWGTHDLIMTGSWPNELWGKLVRKYGAPLMPRECFGRQTPVTLLELRDALLRSTEQMGAISRYLFEQEHWDFYCVVFGAPHRAGHYLWDLSQVDTEHLSSATRATLEAALIEVYQAVDQAAAHLIEQAPADTRIVVFAVHGMGSNPGWSELVPEVIARIQGKGGQRPAKTGLLYALKRKVPFHWLRPVVNRLPEQFQNRLVSAWSARMFDWRTTRYFPLPMDHAGYLRINLRGREARGIVDPDAEYDAICAELETAFKSLRDRDTSTSVVGHVLRTYQQATPNANARHLVPDLVITWAGTSAIDSRGLVSDALGELTFPTVGRLPSGRPGNHSDRGFFIATGPGITPGTRVAGHTIVDLAPTVFEWLAAEPERSFQGRPIPGH